VMLRKYSIEDVALDEARVARYVNESLMLVTALSPVIGYDKAAEIAHRATEHRTTLREAAIASGFISAEEFDRIVVPRKMVGDPHRDLGLPP
jgi:fumarate hydratase, class II